MKPPESKRVKFSRAKPARARFDPVAGNVVGRRRVLARTFDAKRLR